MNLLPFSIDEVNKITRMSQVDRFMRRNCDIESRTYDVPNLGGHDTAATKIYITRGLPRWQWLGQQVAISRFVILREKYAMSLIDAFRELDGRELGELLVHTRMVNRDDGPFEHAYSVGQGAVDYAVKLQYGPSGHRAYERFVEAQNKPFEKCVNPPPDLRRVA
jgi:hypothetical protein